VVKRTALSILAFILCLFFIMPNYADDLGQDSSQILAFSSRNIFPSVSSSKALPSLQIKPYFWEIMLVLSSNGEYTVENGERSNIGHYSFILTWIGCMEEDMDDYIIYHETSDLVEWNAREEVQSPGSSRIISGDDFSKRPDFDFHYILRKDKNLHFDFQVDGFCVPQETSDAKFYLTLPSSYENKRPSSQVDYNAFLLQGSNNIQIEEEEIYQHTIEKTYRWTWKHHQSLSEKNKPISFSNFHNVKVVLTIIPHYSPQP
jgi:hypothetical protein